MKKSLKIAFGAMVAVIALFAAAMLYAAFFFNANDYRNEIAAQVEAATGRSFGIGSIHLSVLPVLGLKLSDAVLGNPKGFSGVPFAKVGEAAVGVRLLPLIIDHRLEIESIYLQDLELTLRKKLDGKTNWGGLLSTQREKKSVSPVSGSRESGGQQIWSAFAVAGLRVANASIRYEDAARGRSVLLKHVDLSAGALRPGKPCPFRISFVTQITKPALMADVKSSGDLTVDFSAHHFALHDYRFRAVASGPSVPTGRQSVALHGGADYNAVSGTVEFKKVTLDMAGVTSEASGQIRDVGTYRPAWEARLHVERFNPGEALSALGVRDYYPKDASVFKLASLSADASGDLHEFSLTHLNLLLDQTSVSGAVSAHVSTVPAIKAVLEVNKFNVDHYLPAVNVGKIRSAASGSPTRPSASPMPLPLAELSNMVADCRLSVQKLVIHGVKLSHANVRVNIAPHGSATATLKADLYGGRITSRTHINSIKKPNYQQVFRLSHVAIGPLLQDFSGNDPVRGQGDVKAALTSGGRTVGALERSLDGTVTVSLKNGAVKGFNLGAILRSLQNLRHFSGQPTLSGIASNTQETDFSSLRASGQISNGILTSTDLRAASPFLRASGAGTINLVNKTIDYTVNPVLVNTDTGQGGKRLSQLHGIEIPVRISGPLRAPRYQVALGALLKKAEKRGLHELLNRKNTTLRDRLKRLFGF